MDIIGSRGIAIRLEISQETARSLLKKNEFRSQIITPGQGDRIRIRTTRRALLLYCKQQGYSLSLEEQNYLDNIGHKSATPNGSEQGNPVGSAELNSPV